MALRLLSGSRIFPRANAGAVFTGFNSNLTDRRQFSVQVPIRRNVFKHTLKEGKKKQIGLWTGLSSTLVAEMLGHAGYDWTVIDMEHSPNELKDVLLQLQVAQGHGTAEPVVRVPINEPVIVKRVLDLGAQTILFPLINTAEEAAAAVAATRYPPHGVRGVMSLARMNKYGYTSDYYHKAHEETCVICQVETMEAVANIPAIAAVEGVDAVFVGPSDLSASAGHLGNPLHPEVQAAIQGAIEACVANKIPCGFLSGDEAQVKQALSWGCTFAAVGSDMAVLTKNATALNARFQEFVGNK